MVVSAIEVLDRGRALISPPATYQGGSQWRVSKVFSRSSRPRSAAANSRNSSLRLHIGMAADVVAAWSVSLLRRGQGAQRFARCQAANECESRVAGSAKSTCRSRGRRSSSRPTARSAIGDTAGMSRNSQQCPGGSSSISIAGRARNADDGSWARSSDTDSTPSGRCGFSLSRHARGVVTNSRKMRRHAARESTSTMITNAAPVMRHAAFASEGFSVPAAMYGWAQSNLFRLISSWATWPTSGSI